MLDHALEHLSTFSLQHPTIMGTILTLCLGFVGLCCWRLYSNWSQLNHIPGPLLAGLSDYWRAWYQRRGELRGKLVELHKQHGPVVRYGVRSVSVNDPSAVDVVYGSRAGFVIVSNLCEIEERIQRHRDRKTKFPALSADNVSQADSYSVIKAVARHGDVDSLITLADEQRHNTLRRSIANAFTAKTTLDYEPHIDRTIEELLLALGREPVFDLGAKMSYFGLDAAAGFAFNAPKSCLAADADVDGMITLTRDRARHWSRWASIPGTEALLFRNPIARMLKGGAPSGIVAAAISKLKERTGEEVVEKDSESPDLLTRFIEAMQNNPETLDQAGVISLLMSTISGASDTTATAMTATMFHLLQNPETLAKLQKELEAVDLSRPVPTFVQTSKLPYLHAVIREGMRLFPPLSHPLERLVPTGGVEICGKFLPQGASVGCLQMALHLNPKAFGDDAEVFRPERWLEVSADRLRVMEACHLGFGRGRRVCLGQNLAVMEMKKVIPAVLLNFDVSVGFVSFVFKIVD